MFSVMSALAVAVQPLASVTVTLCFPGASLVAVAVVSPLSHL